MKVNWERVAEWAKWLGPRVARFVAETVAAREAKKRGDTLRKVVVIAAMVITTATVACKSITRVDPCRLIPCVPSPSPSAQPTPQPSPSAQPSPSPTPGPSVPPDRHCEGDPATWCECVYRDGRGGLETVSLPCPSPPSPTPKPKPCKVDEDQLPCWTCRARLDYDVAHGHLTYDPARKLWHNGPASAPFDWIDGACNLVDPSTRAVLRTAAQQYGEWPEHSQGLCSQAYLDSLCPKPSPTPDVTPSPVPTAQPGRCGPPVRVGGGLFNCQIKGQPIACAKTLPAGASVTLDHTLHWRENGPGTCDEPRDTACGPGVICDSLDQLEFSQTGPTQGHASSTHQWTVRSMARGGYSLQTCVPDSYTSPNGVVTGGSRTRCATTSWFVE